MNIQQQFVIQVDFYCSWPILLCFGMLVLCDGLVAEWFYLWNVFLPVLFSLVGPLFAPLWVLCFFNKSFLVHQKRVFLCSWKCTEKWPRLLKTDFSLKLFINSIVDFCFEDLLVLSTKPWPEIEQETPLLNIGIWKIIVGYIHQLNTPYAAKVESQTKPCY